MLTMFLKPKIETWYDKFNHKRKMIIMIITEIYS